MAISTFKKKLLLLFFLLLPSLPFISGRWFGFSAFSQQYNTGSEPGRIIDSLITLLKTDKEDTLKVNHFSTLSRLYSDIGELDKGLKYGNSALELSKKMNYKKGIANSYLNIGIVLDNQGNFTKALENYFAALKISEEIGEKQGIADSYLDIGGVFYYQGNYDKALENFYASIKISEEMGNKKGIAFAYTNIGTIYSMQGNNDKALENFITSLKISEEDGNQQGIALAYNNIGVIYEMQGSNQKSLENYLASLKISLDIGNKRGIALAYHNIGYIYKKQKKFDKALENFFASLKISEEIGDKYGIADSYSYLGIIYLELNKISEARKHHLLALDISKNIGAKDLMVTSFQFLAQCDSASGNWRGAFEYQKFYKQYNDSIFNETRTAKTAEMNARYESEKKEAQLVLMEKEKENQAAISAAENKKQQIIIWSIAGGLLLVGIVLIVVFRSLRITRKQKQIIELQKDEVTKQKEIVEEQKAVVERQKNVVMAQKRLVEEQKEEISFKNKALTDSINYAQRIQHAILTSEQYLNEMFIPDGQVSSHFILYKPKDIVAGDFYWAYKTPDGIVIWVSVDCTGHGVPGAFMSMIGNSLLNEIVVEKGIHEPDEILNKMRAGVIKALGQSGGEKMTDGLPSEMKMKDGMDAALCCWNKATNKISFAGANNSLWIIRNGRFTEIEPDIQPIGHFLETIKPFTKKEFQLHPGDTLYTFTDGYCDQFGGPKGKKFKYRPFRELLLSIQDKPMREQGEILNNTIDNWRGKLEQIDDICVFGVRV